MSLWKTLLPKHKLLGRNEDPSPKTANAKVSRRWKTYHYTPLDPTRSEFRMLILSAIDYKGRLSGTLKTVSMLDDPKPEYKTLSYAWGNTTSSSFILLDQKRLDIPASAHQALGGMLCNGYRGAVWIDSVCIDQANRQEREQQVSMMGGDTGIYPHGQLNIIWLGASDDSTPRAIEAMSLILHEMREATGENFERLSETLLDPVTNDMLYSATPFFVDFDHAALLRFFDRAWFRRLWVVQEAFLSPSNVVLSGDFEIQLLDVVRAARWFLYKFDHIRPTSSWLSQQKILQPTEMLFDLIDRTHGWSRGQSHISIHYSLYLARAFDTTLPADRIFATLGLLAPESRNSKLLRPDYRKPLVQVLRDATYAALLEVKYISSVLRNVWRRTDEEVEGKGFPSWVPQWHRAGSESFDPASLNASQFQAAAGLAFQGPEHGHLDGNDLSVEGLLVDRVRETGHSIIGVLLSILVTRS